MPVQCMNSNHINRSSLPNHMSDFFLTLVIDLEIDIDKKEGKKSQKRLSIWKSFAICLDMKHNQVS